MRSIDSMDELEESDLENSSILGDRSSNSDVSTPSPSEEEQREYELHDLDKSCDSYGVRIHQEDE